MKKIFIDTNILLDALLEREPWMHNAATLFTLADEGKLMLFCSSLSFATANYMLHKHKFTKEEIIRKLLISKLLCKITKVDEQTVEKALLSEFADFEDALQYYSAIESEVDLIITRNKKDFQLSDIAVMTPDEFLN